MASKELIERANRAAARLNAELTRTAPALSAALEVQPSYATQGLPDPNVTGPCQLQSSPFCEQTGGQRMDPLDMLETETAFRGYVQGCQPCYDHNATRFVAESHGRTE